MGFVLYSFSNKNKKIANEVEPYHVFLSKFGFSQGNLKFKTWTTTITTKNVTAQKCTLNS